jgi:ketosteroid isomerase-like protein
MAEHPNAQRMREAYETFGAGNVDQMDQYFAKDIKWHVSGGSSLAGDYDGIDGVMEFFGKLMQGSGGTFRLSVHDVLANDEHGAALLEAHAEREGRTLDQKVVHVFHFKDGMASEFWGFPENTTRTDEFWGSA